MPSNQEEANFIWGKFAPFNPSPRNLGGGPLGGVPRGTYRFLKIAQQQGSAKKNDKKQQKTEKFYFFS